MTVYPPSLTVDKWASVNIFEEVIWCLTITRKKFLSDDFQHMTRHPVTPVSAGGVGLWGLNSSHAALIPRSCDMTVKSIRPSPSLLHYNTHHCIGMCRTIINESLSVWMDGENQWRKNVTALCSRQMNERTVTEEIFRSFTSVKVLILLCQNTPVQVSAFKTSLKSPLCKI